MKVALIVNPAAGTGRAKAIGARLQERIPEATLYFTEHPGDGVRWAEAATRQRARMIVAVGGDGTISECCTGLARGAARNDRPPLAIVPAGTGSDYGRTFQLDGGLEGAVQRILRGGRRRVDLGKYRLGTDREGETRYFNNVLSFGIGGLTDRIVNQGPKWLGGRLAFFLGGVKATVAYNPTPLRLTFDDGQVEFGAPQNVAVCLGKYFGGGMKIAPDADPADGAFDVVIMSGSKLQTLALAKDIYLGAHLRRADVLVRRTRTLTAEPTRPGEVLVDADGEQTGSLPLTAQVEPQALELVL